MAGIEHDCFRDRNHFTTRNNELVYYIIQPDDLPSNFSREFLKKLQGIRYQEKKDPDNLHPRYYELRDSIGFETILHLFFKMFNHSITFQEIRNFVRGSKLLPGGDPLDPEEDFWIIEKQKVTKILDSYLKANFDELSNFNELKSYLETEYKEPISDDELKDWLEWIKNILDILVPPLEQDLLILCVWDQS